MRIECVSCRHKIDARARICPYCGADPHSGERFDPRPLLEKHFPRRGELSGTERVLEFFRARQGIVVTAVIAVLFLLLVYLHNLITRQSLNRPSDVPAIPLTEIADLSKRTAETEPLPIPQLEFQFAGSGQQLRTLLIEPGAVAPPEPPELTTESPTLNRFTEERPRPAPPPPPVVTTDTAETYTPTEPPADPEPQTSEPSPPQW